MAILGEFRVEVIVDGIPANEYVNDEIAPAKPNTITKYVEAVSGAGFGFHAQIDPSYRFTDEDCICVELYVDGKWAATHILSQHSFEDDVGRGRTPMVSLTGKYTMVPDGTAYYKFQFANLETRRLPDRTFSRTILTRSGDTAESDDLSEFPTKYGDLGKFHVEFWRGKRLGLLPGVSSSAEDVGTVPEKALKGRPLDVASRLVQTRASARWSLIAKALFRLRFHRFRSFVVLSTSTNILWQNSNSNIEHGVRQTTDLTL